MKKKFYTTTLTIIIILISAFFIRQYLDKMVELKLQKQESWLDGKTYAAMVEEENKALQYFKARFADREVILACENDITNDGLTDLLVIYRERGDTRLVAVCDKGDGNWYISPEIPAPVENQTIRFKNIDKEAEMEFIISGEKKGAVGYAIYRMIEGEIKDLFGEGMEDCCQIESWEHEYKQANLFYYGNNLNCWLYDDFPFAKGCWQS